MKKSYSVKEFIDKKYNANVKEVLKYNSNLFEERFKQKVDHKIELEVIFESSYEATLFHQEIKTNRNYNSLFKVKTHPYKPRTLLVFGKETLFDYLGSVEPNLLTLSRNLNIDFAVEFVQSFSGTKFKGHVVNGELLSRQCLVEVSDVLPELSLGLLLKIGGSVDELDLLLTRIIPVETQVIL